MRRTAAVALPLLAVLMLAVWRSAGPEPRPAAAPATSFSAERAAGILRTILSEGVPHPTGSQANALVRDRVVAEFRRLGYEPSIQRRFACNSQGSCATVENIIAPHPGRSGGKAVLVVAHYDSVGAGPGASDDGMGVAALLEIARAVKNDRFRNPVVFLVDDGEEAGLLGAEAFMADESLSRDVSVVINVENRGTWGASNMFETSAGNRWLIRHLARALERPHTSSLFYAVYKVLPNDTDVTVFRREGKAAVNFAAIRGAGWYHTPLDDLSHASLRTLQHHGDNALATLRVLGDADPDARSSTDAVWFDLLGFTLVWWPQEWTPWMAAVSLALLVFAARKNRAREMTFGVLACFAALALSGAGGFALSWLARARSEGIPWVAQPLPLVAAMWSIGIASALFAASIFRNRAKPVAMIHGAAIVWHMIAGALALALPGASFLFLVPAMTVTACALLRAGESRTGTIAATSAAVVTFPVAIVLYEALGGPMAWGLAVLIGALFTLAAPLFAATSRGAFAAVLAACFAAGSLLVPAWTEEHPRRISIVYLDDAGAPGPVWTAQSVTPGMQTVAAFETAARDAAPWTRAQVRTAPATAGLAPRIDVSGARAGDRVSVRLRPRRPADRIVLLVKGDARVVRVNGVTLPPRPASARSRLRDGWTWASAMGVDELTAEIEAKGGIDVVGSDMSYGLPAAGARLAAARSASTAVPIQDGDVTVTRTPAKF